MSAIPYQYSSLGDVHPDFAPLVAGLNENFERIWTPEDVPQLRWNFQSSRAPIPGVPVDGFDISHRMVPVLDGSEVEIRIYRPTPAGARATSNLPLLFVAHGGGVKCPFPLYFERLADCMYSISFFAGWVVGDHESEGAMSRLLCVRNQVVVVSVNFRRAPEHPFPTPLNDTYDAYKWTISHAAELGVDSRTIVLGGTSAGANLVAALTLRLKQEGGLNGVVGQLLNIPALCHPRFLPHKRHELRSYEQNAQSPTINGERMRWFWDQYLPNANPNALASPLLASQFDGLPPALIQVAGLDPLRDEGLAYAKELTLAGVLVDVRIHAGVPHGFVFATELECTRQYFQSMVDWMTGVLGQK
ncbi:alpha/beta hydrolase fold-domain-containing protein [Aspergillus cavernicola]|uniref:Alpha/beta hydrolase fold-domain-containing protein n=1 Tax=Aspergillus cavernicola TaxID=176166 RepID=A0ABR4I7B2_9EURO